MRSHLRPVTLGLAAAAALSCAALTSAGPAAALPPCCNAETIITYYSDASHTTVVGHVYEGDCLQGQDGVTSDYQSVRNMYC